MARDDRIRWDERYRSRDAGPLEPLPFLMAMGGCLPRRGRALDVAGGAGGNAIWLARRGLEVTVADISPVGLQLAQDRARAEGIRLRTLEVDLEEEAFPAGPWELVLCVRFLWKPLFEMIPAELSPGGKLIVVHPTRSNLVRHERPGLRHLLDDVELPGLIRGLEVEHYEEGWTAEGRHEARLLARRSQTFSRREKVPRSGR